MGVFTKILIGVVGGCAGLPQRILWLALRFLLAVALVVFEKTLHVFLSHHVHTFALNGAVHFEILVDDSQH